MELEIDKGAIPSPKGVAVPKAWKLPWQKRAKRRWGL